MDKYDNIDPILSELFCQCSGEQAAPRFSTRKAWWRFRRDHFRRAVPGWGMPVWARYAVAVVAAVGIFFGARYSGRQSIRQEFADISVSAPMGSNTQVTLPDGTQVWLNAGSRLTYSQGFGVDDRTVHIEGEGYFEVARNEEIPFMMRSEALRLQVLGTKFDFRDYPDDDLVEVSLVEGSVELSSLLEGGASVRLKPDQRCVLDKQSGRMHVESVSARQSAVWTEGRLFFDEEPLERIARTLAHSYNVEVRIERDELRQVRFYGVFARREQNIGEVLDILTQTGKVRYRMDGKAIILY